MEKADPIFSYRLGTEEDVYSNVNQSDYNMKPVFLYCQYCKFYIKTALAGAQCKKCNSNLIVLLPRMQADELARSDS